MNEPEGRDSHSVRLANVPDMSCRRKGGPGKVSLRIGGEVGLRVESMASQMGHFGP